MKWIFRLLTLGSLAVALLLPFFIKDGGGNALWSVPGVSDDNTPTLVKLDGRLPQPDHVSEVYKWRDANGQWHYSDAPPTDDSAVEVVRVSSRTNIIQSVKLPTKEATSDMTAPPRSAQQQETLQRLDESPLTLERIQNVMEDTRAVREMMEQRNQALEAMDR